MKKQKPTDNNIKLIAGLKKGTDSSYHFIVSTYNHMLCVHAYRFTNDFDKAKDIVQNVFIKFWNQRENLTDDFSVKDYLYKAVYNEFIDQYRKGKSVLNLDTKYFEAVNSAIEEDEENSDENLISSIKKEIENLPAKCKEVFLLSKKEGLSNLEIAEHLNTSVKSVEAHITKAFKILRKVLGSTTETILFIYFGTYPKAT